MSNPVLFVPGIDQFERAEFDATLLNDENATVRGASHPRLTFRTNTGQALTFELGDKSKFYDDLAAWAVKVAEALRSTNR
jgi:hypothetical protein